jgi:predicted enzyme related to lactoylglutathione lyase
VKSNLDFVLLYVPDLAAARTFYTTTVGLEVEDENPAFIQFRRPSGAIFALQHEAGAKPHAGVELWWLLENADQAHEELVARGARIAEPLADRPFGRAFAIADPFGNALHFFQPLHA